MIWSQKPKSNICSHAHMVMQQIKNDISEVLQGHAYQTWNDGRLLERVTTMATWHYSRVTNKSHISDFTWFMTTKVGDGLWYWATMHKVPWVFDHVIICSLMTNIKRYISNSTSPTDTRVDRVVGYDMGPTFKKSHHSS